VPSWAACCGDLKPRLESFDYVYVFGTTATLATKSIVQDKVPIIFNIVADPVGAGLVRSLEASGGNIAGVTNEIPLSLQLKTALTVIPMKRLGLLFNPREKNAMLVRDKIVEVARPWGSGGRSPLAAGAGHPEPPEARDRSIAVDAVYLPADNLVSTPSSSAPRTG
jgi:ABC-type uncharacterized transport system substrate-binding protein